MTASLTPGSISLGTPGNIWGSFPLTLAILFYPTAGGWSGLMQQGQSVGNSGARGWWLGFDPSGSVFWNMGQGPNGGSSAIQVIQNTWNLLVFVARDAGNQSRYHWRYDNRSFWVKHETVASTSFNSPVAGDPAYLGTWNNGSYTEQFTGLMDWAGVWSADFSDGGTGADNSASGPLPPRIWSLIQGGPWPEAMQSDCRGFYPLMPQYGLRPVTPNPNGIDMGPGTLQAAGTVVWAPPNAAGVPFAEYMPAELIFREQPTLRVPSGTLYTQSLAGSVSPGGGLLKQAQKPFAGTLTPGGILVRQPRKQFAGSETPSGIIVRQPQKLLVGSETPAGAIVRQPQKLLAGTETPAGTLVRQPRKNMAGQLTPSGTLVRSIAKSFAGTVTPAGTLVAVKAFLRTFTATVTPAGALLRQTAKALAAQLTPTGTMVKQTTRMLGGSESPAGTVIATRVLLKTVGGSLAATGSIIRRAAKALAGLLTPSGSLARQFAGTTALPGRHRGAVRLADSHQSSVRAA